MTALKVGDRVKVAAFEATVRQIGGVTGLPYVQRDGETGYVRIYPDLAEVIPPSPQVGDTIEGADAYEALPLGTIVSVPTGVWFTRMRDGWSDTFGTFYRDGAVSRLSAPRKLRYLPPQ